MHCLALGKSPQRLEPGKSKHSKPHTPERVGQREQEERLQNARLIQSFRVAKSRVVSGLTPADVIHAVRKQPMKAQECNFVMRVEEHMSKPPSPPHCS